MRHLSIIILTMGIFKLFGQEKPKSDPYWEFDKTKQFRPKLNKGDFFKLTGFDFGWFVLEPISKFIKDKEHEIERGKSLSYGQKALYYWWYVDAQVTNGGFVQFYYNGYGPYAPTIIKSLKHIGDEKMADLIQRAENIYQKNKKLIDKAREKDLFGSDLYDRLEELSTLDDEYYDLNEKTMTRIEKYIRNNPNEIALDEDGKEFDTKFSGECKTYYTKHKVKETFFLQNGLINGEFKSYYENGNLNEAIQYLNGVQTGERIEFYESGGKKYSASKDIIKKQFEHFWYYENGKAKKLEHKQLDRDERKGEYKEWYENGQLSETGTYISNHERDGEWLEFYENGNRKVEAEFKSGHFLLKNHWSKDGIQTLKEGTGLYVYEYKIFEDKVERNEQEYKNYKRHGQQKSYTNGILTLYQEMEDGEEHGYTRTYYKNGKIKEEKYYKHGKEISAKLFPKSENPVGKVTFQFLMKEEWLKDAELPIADTYPICINENEIKKMMKIPRSLFEPQYQDVQGSTCLWLSVNEKGKVINVEFRSAYMTNGDEFLAVAPKMKFKPATKDGKNIASYIYIICDFEVE